MKNIEELTLQNFRAALRELFTYMGGSHREHIREVQDRAKQDETFPGTLSDVRTMLSQIARSPSNPFNTQSQPYHLALIFDHEGVTEGTDSWQYIRSRKKPNFNPAEHLLGTVAVISDREIMQTLIHTAADIGEWSHPVFDKYGTIRFPHQ